MSTTAWTVTLFSFGTVLVIFVIPIMNAIARDAERYHQGLDDEPKPTNRQIVAVVGMFLLIVTPFIIGSFITLASKDSNKPIWLAFWPPALMLCLLPPAVAKGRRRRVGLRSAQPKR